MYSRQHQLSTYKKHRFLDCSILHFVVCSPALLTGIESITEGQVLTFSFKCLRVFTSVLGERCRTLCSPGHTYSLQFLDDATGYCYCAATVSLYTQGACQHPQIKTNSLSLFYFEILRAGMQNQHCDCTFFSCALYGCITITVNSCGDTNLTVIVHVHIYYFKCIFECQSPCPF